MDYGSRWRRAGRTAVLDKPSALVQQERNYLLNPADPDFRRIRIRIGRALSRDRLFSGWSSEPPPRRSSRRQVLKAFEIRPG